MLRLALALALAQFGFHSFIASLPVALVGAGRSEAEIGVIVGSAALVPMVAALAAGGLIDRYGGRLVFMFGSASLLGAAALFAGSIATPDGSTAVLLLPRILQGLGIAFVMPAALSLVPGLVERPRLGTALGLVGVGANISLAISPPLSLVILQAASLQAVGVTAMIPVVVAMLLVWGMPRPAFVSAGEGRSGWRAFYPSWRKAWKGPLLVTLLFLVHWGIITSYLPERAVLAGADIGLFFTADAVAILALRVPAGYLAGRLGTRWLIVSGVIVTVLALSLLLLPATTLLLIVAGLGTGAGGALILPPLTLELSERSSDADRGSAFALFNIAFSGGIAVGSLAVAPIIGSLGFETVLLASIAAASLAGVIAAADRTSAAPVARAGSAPGVELADDVQ
jgi:DHA1 family solute carrier family 18 vesicular amine transporter 1/2